MPQSSKPASYPKLPTPPSLEAKLAALDPPDREWMETVIRSIGPDEVERNWDNRLAEMRRVRDL